MTNAMLTTSRGCYGANFGTVQAEQHFVGTRQLDPVGGPVGKIPPRKTLRRASSGSTQRGPEIPYHSLSRLTPASEVTVRLVLRQTEVPSTTGSGDCV